MNKRVKVSPDKYFLKADIAVYALIVAFICLSCSVFYFFKKQDEQGFEAVYRGQTVLTMYFDAPEKYEVAEKFSSDVSVTAEDGEYAFKITLENGKYINEFRVVPKERSVEMTYSNCAKNDCRHMDFSAGGLIICAPHNFKIVAVGGDYPIIVG